MASYLEDLKKANKQQQESINKGTQDVAAAMEQQGQAYLDNVQAAQAAQAAADAAAERNYNNLLERYNNDFAAMVKGENDRIMAEQQQAKKQIEADNNAAKWSGLTELVSSVANLIGVGGHNAISQQYRPYSQDWMRKAEQDMREHRYRIDNLRARQNAIRQQMTQMQMGQAADALQRARQDAERAYNDRLNMAQQTYNIGMAPVQQRAAGAEKAAEAGARAAQAEASVGMQQEHLGLQQAQFAESQKQNELNRLASGFVPDGKGGYSFDPEEAAKKLGVKDLTQVTKKSSSGGSDNPVGYNYPVTIDGQQVTLQFKNKESRDNALKTGIGDLRKDMANEAAQRLRTVGYPVSGDLDWDKLVRLAEQKKLEVKGQKIDNPLYGWEPATIQALQGSGDNDMDYDIIEDYFNRNSQRLNNFNRYLYRASDAQKQYGVTSSSPQTPIVVNEETGTATPAPSGGSIFSEFATSAAPQTSFGNWTAQNKRKNNVLK